MMLSAKMTKCMSVSHCKNGVVVMTYSLSFWLQMSEPIIHMDTDNYMTIHHKRASYYDCTAYLGVFCSLV